MNKIICSVVTVFCFFLISPTFCSAYEESNLSKGVNAYQNSDFQNAYQYFLKAFEEDPENLKLNFYLGRSAFESKDYEMAVMAYERILIASPNDLRVKLEIARAFHQMGSSSIARKYCNEVLASKPPASVTANIEAFLKKIDDAEKIHFYNTQLNIGCEWNDNIWATPTRTDFDTILGQVTLSGDASKKKSGFIVSAMLDQTHIYKPLYSNKSWITNAILYQASNNRTHELDTFYMGAQTGPAIEFDRDLLKFALAVNEYELAENPYSDSVGLTGSWHHTFNPGFIFTSTLSGFIHNYPSNSAKDSHETSMLVETGLSLYDTWIRLGAKILREKAYADQYSNYRYSGFFSASRQLHKYLTGSINYEYQYAGYDDAATLFGRNRMDHSNLVGISLTRQIFKTDPRRDFKFFLGLTCRHIWTYSNIPLYEYDKDLVQIMLTCKF